MNPDEIAAEIMRQVTERGADKSICPSEVARALAPDAWRPLLGPVRQAAMALARQGALCILRKGKTVSPEDLRGVIRLSLPAPPLPALPLAAPPLAAPPLAAKDTP